MQVFVDNEPLDIDVAHRQSLRDLVDGVQAELARRCRVVKGIAVDGRPVAGDRAEEMLSQPLGQSARVEFQTACPRTLGRDALSAVKAMLKDTACLQRGAAERLSAGQTGKAMEMLLGCLNHFRLAQEAIQQSVLLNRVDLDQVQVGGLPAAAVIQSLAGQLGDVKTALESRDFAMLGDLLNYELPKATEQWQAIVAELDRVLEQRVVQE